ncbi:MAG: Fur family transcriptional regulator [Candidatus Cryosericum sp.]|nr:transcriptional repressor [bacterium]
MDTLSGKELLQFRTAPQLKGFRLTRERRVILNVLLEAEKPLTAEEILERLQADIALSTVYRTLDKLVRRGYVQQTLLSTDGHAVFELTGKAHRHYMVCLDCHRMFPLASCPIKGFHDRSAEEVDFEVVDHSLVLYGYCHDCRARRKSLGSQ